MPWAPLAVPPPLEEGEVHLWRIDLERERDLGSLSPDERETAARFAEPAAGRHRATARAALRILLGGYQGADPAALRIDVGPHGKPFLAEPPPLSDGLEFNLSHSGSDALVAVARMTVGVDLERTVRRTPVDERRLANRFFTPAEVAAWQAGRKTDAAFFRLWTRKEAVLKAHGGGLGAGLNRFAVAAAWPPTGEAYSVLWPPAVDWEGTRYFLYDLDIGPGLHAALAVVGGVEKIRQFTLA